MFKVTALLVLGSVALAVPAPYSTLPDVGSSLTRAFEQFKLARRQTLGQGGSGQAQALQGLEDTLGKAVNNPGNCASACSPWVSALQDCVANSSGATAIGRCACRTSNVQEATTCGDCFGGEDATNAKDFADLCESATSGAGTISGPGSFTRTSATGTAGGLASATSGFASASAGASSRTASAIAGAASTVSSAGAAQSSAPVSGASQVKAGGLAFALGAVALMI